MFKPPASHQIRNQVGGPRMAHLVGGDMPRQMRMAALAIGVIVAFSGLSLAQYHDDGYYQGTPVQARQYGYQRGY